MSIDETVVHVWCDKCHEEADPMHLTLLAGGRSWDDRNIRPRLTREGWRVDGDLTICPECVAVESAAVALPATDQ